MLKKHAATWLVNTMHVTFRVAIRRVFKIEERIKFFFHWSTINLVLNARWDEPIVLKVIWFFHARIYVSICVFLYRLIYVTNLPKQLWNNFLNLKFCCNVFFILCPFTSTQIGLECISFPCDLNPHYSYIKTSSIFFKRWTSQKEMAPPSFFLKACNIEGNYSSVTCALKSTTALMSYWH